jgi:endonuclease YncB( thermonuclease family)
MSLHERRCLRSLFALSLLLLCILENGAAHDPYADENAAPATGQYRERRMLRLFLEIRDGDTVVYMGSTMRFLGVDTPELRNPELGFWYDQAYGREAKEFTRRQIREARRVTFVQNGRDRYGRLLVHLLVDGYPLSVRIVEAGLGYETVSVYGDNGFPEIAEMILDASKRHDSLPFEKPYMWRWKNRARR